jgi:hypothetical protein
MNLDTTIINVGAEDPILHTITFNDQVMPIAIEIQNIVLVGPSYKSVNSEYRQFNFNTHKAKKLIVSSSTAPGGKVYKIIYDKLFAAVKNDKELMLKNASYSGISYLVLFYILCKHYKITEVEMVSYNNFTIIVSLIDIIDKILKNTKVSMIDIKQLCEWLLDYNNQKNKIEDMRLGSKILTITRNDMLNSNDVLKPIWKIMYINKILKNIVIDDKILLFSPSIDWGFMKTMCKRTFTNKDLLSKIIFGDKINILIETNKQQVQITNNIISNNTYLHEINDIKDYIVNTKNKLSTLNYILNDIALILIYKNNGETIYSQMNKIMNKSSDHTLILDTISNTNMFHSFVFQYLFGVLSLAKRGIIHNDPHFNNILLESTPIGNISNFEISPGNIISINTAGVKPVIIDFDKSILSKYHHNGFESIADKINEEMSIIFGDVKKTIVDNFDQVFSCYIMYDVIRFGLGLKQIMVDNLKNHISPSHKSQYTKNLNFIEKMIMSATNMLEQIYMSNHKLPFDPSSKPYGSIEWLILHMFKENLKSNKNKSSMSMIDQVIKMHSSNGDKPGFIAARRKYADELKYEFLSKYVSQMIISG